MVTGSGCDLGLGELGFRVGFDVYWTFVNKPTGTDTYVVQILTLVNSGEHV